MNRDIVKRLAAQLGFESLDVPILSVFATAIIENYKAGLVPVACIVSSNYCQCNLQKLYALGETK